MASLLLDHNVSREYIALLAAHGHRAWSARDEALDRADDGAILLAAATLGRVLVTHNGNDFWLLHRAWHHWSAAWQVNPRPRHAGILVLPQRPHLGPEQLTNRAHELLADQTDLANRLYEWTVGRGWVLDDIP
ncbi:MAG: DUF5615 family PIN-like protein [Dehalococcoidia bacterium]